MGVHFDACYASIKSSWLPSKITLKLGETALQEELYLTHKHTVQQSNCRTVTKSIYQFILVNIYICTYFYVCICYL